MWETVVFESPEHFEPPEHLVLLGDLRLSMLSALGCDNPRLPGFFDPPPSISIFDAYRDHIERLSRDWADRGCDGQEALTRRLLGAGRLLAGELAGADEILNNLPAEPTERPFGARYVPLLPQRMLRWALPLPREKYSLSWPDRLCENSPEQADMRRWLSYHRERLIWQEIGGFYLLA